MSSHRSHIESHRTAWTNKHDVALIQFVKAHECLFNTRNKNFRKSQLKYTLWQHIGNQINKTDITMPKNNKKSSDEGQNKKSTVRPPAKTTAQRNREYRARQKALRNAVNQCTAVNQPSTSACVNDVYGDITSTTTSQEQVADSHRSIVVQVDVHQKSIPVLLDEPSTSAVREDNGRNITRTAEKPTAKTSTERSREYRKRIARVMEDVIETQATLMETARHKTAERTRAYRARMRAIQHTDVPEPAIDAAIEQLRANSPALSGHECSKRWSYVRDYYIRRRGVVETGFAGSDGKKRRDLLSFLDQVSVKKSTNINDSQFEETENSEFQDTELDDTSAENEGSVLEDNAEMVYLDTSNDILQVKNELPEPSTSKEPSSYIDIFDDLPAPKRKKPAANNFEMAERSYQSDEQDVNDLFFAAMSKIVQTLPEIEQAQLRLKISTMVGSAEVEHLTRQQENNF